MNDTLFILLYADTHAWIDIRDNTFDYSISSIAEIAKYVNIPCCIMICIFTYAVCMKYRIFVYGNTVYVFVDEKKV
jgi:succinate dehydrogenase hydrophobic anchor subunit